MADEKRSGRQIAADIFSSIGNAFTPAPQGGLAQGIAALGSTVGDAIKKRRKQNLLDKLGQQQTDGSALQSNKYEDMA